MYFCYVFQLHLKGCRVFIFIAQKVLDFSDGWEFPDSYNHHLPFSGKDSASWKHDGLRDVMGPGLISAAFSNYLIAGKNAVF